LHEVVHVVVVFGVANVSQGSEREEMTITTGRAFTIRERREEENVDIGRG
jgi:hypothetical protein